MKTQIALKIFLIVLVLLLSVESKTTDPYKVSSTLPLPNCFPY